jgi:hypothetical protein
MPIVVGSQAMKHLGMAWVALFPALAVTGACSTEQTATGAKDKPSGAAATAAVKASAKASAAATAKPGKPTGPVAALADLEKIKLPVPAKLPKGAAWETAGAPISEDGYWLSNCKVGGKDYWLTFTAMDCRRASISTDPKSDSYVPLCVEPGAEKLQGYPVIRKGDFVGLRVGNLFLSSDIGAQAKGLTPADTEAFLLSLDLAAFAKL